MRLFKNHTAQALFAIAVLGSLHNVAQPNEALARKSDCFGCHSVASKLVGPAYKEVPAKYAGQADALEQVQNSIRNGGAGKWGETPMPPNPKRSAADVKKLATWVLGLK